MKKEELLKQFVSDRPACLGAYGYGSKIFKQLGYSEQTKAQYDIIFVVENISKWHKDNYKLNPKDYSFIGKHILTSDKMYKLKKNTGMTYQSNILFNDAIFKYGVIDRQDFAANSLTWKSLYVTGRFHKPTLPIVTNNVLDDIINKNRELALFTSIVLLDDNGEQTLEDLYMKICELSYAGDTRMKIAENPNKVKNIVIGNYEFFKDTYGTGNKYFGLNDDGIIEKNISNIMSDIDKLPFFINMYLNSNDYSKDNLIAIKNGIIDFLTTVNKKESKEQTIKGIMTNGVIRSAKYAFPKVIKKIKNL